MNPTKKSQKRSNSGKASASDAPSPFELAQTAIALCQLGKKDPESFPPSKYFRRATELLAEAKNHLAEDWPANIALFKIRMEIPGENFGNYRLAGIPIPFSKLLIELDEPHAGKKPRTSVGTINTQNGLATAIRRYFSKVEAARIIQAKAMTCDEWQKLRTAQRESVKLRAEKRVKR
jgi:hypothetical protein